MSGARMATASKDGFTRFSPVELKGHGWFVCPIRVARHRILSCIRRMEGHGPSARLEMQMNDGVAEFVAEPRRKLIS